MEGIAAKNEEGGPSRLCRWGKAKGRQAGWQRREQKSRGRVRRACFVLMESCGTGRQLMTCWRTSTRAEVRRKGP